jgi:hypothetical protein
MLLWMAALVVGAAPRRLWPDLERHLPITRTATPAGILIMVVGFAIGVDGFLKFSTGMADANNTWMLRQLSLPSTANEGAIGMLPYGMSAITLFIFLFFTPTGLLAVYLVTSGTVRAVAAYADAEDARGDFLLSGADWAATTLFAKNRHDRQRIARERLEGAEAPDRLQTGAWAGLPDADYVVLAARRKAEWDAGAIILTSSDWYKLGVPFDIQTPAGLRTAYPLKKMDTVEVVRRGIQYELPRLSSAAKRGTQRPQS